MFGYFDVSRCAVIGSLADRCLWNVMLGAARRAKEGTAARLAFVRNCLSRRMQVTVRVVVVEGRLILGALVLVVLVGLD